MEGLAPSLELLIEVRFNLEANEPLSQAIKKYITQNSGEFPQAVKLWYEGLQKESGSTPIIALKSTYQRNLLWLLERGVRGASIHAQLVELEGEMLLACENQLESFVALLPMKSMIPLLLLLFPAFMVLLIGPILIQLVSSLSL